ncbi:MAG TPA: lipoprotein insertase outer membrane protein LolB [Geobacteraceae bacterium]|nr:lipoprotein insertase outer membrane protein LolB [Geobacteraceae bacterium]
MPFLKTFHITKCLTVTAVLFLFLSSCATVPKPVVPVKPGKEVETLQSEVSLSISNSRGSMGGRGYLIFKRPDRFRLVVLAPFGLTMMEVFVDGERITCLVPSKETAYAGTFTELPDYNALKGWSMMRWVIDNPPSTSATDGGVLERIGANGGKEFLYFDGRGLLEKKTNEEGDQVLYRDYRDIGGVAFPAAIELSNRMGDRVRVAFKEPELNLPVDDATLVPNLEGVTVLPIDHFKGF